MNLLFLGTGAGVPAKQRNVTSIALKLLEERNAIWLFDCGEATQHQILHTTIKPRKIEKIFITHLHGDHIFGLPGFIGSRSFQGGETELTIYGPKGINRFIETSLETSQTHVKYPLKIVEISEGLVFEDEQFIVEAKSLVHGVPSFGYRITEKDKPGTLDSNRLRNEGITPGPIYKQLKLGKTMTLADGRTINGADYLGPDKKGKVIAIFGDTKPCVQAQDLAKDATVLIHEATFNAESNQLANEYFHSTTVQAAELAKAANVKKLCLTHISSRYGLDQSQELVAEAKEVFANTVIAHDFFELPID